MFNDSICRTGDGENYQDGCISVSDRAIDVDGVRRITVAQKEEGFRIKGWCRAPEKTEDSEPDYEIMHSVSCLREGKPSDAKTTNSTLKTLNPTSKPKTIDGFSETSTGKQSVSELLMFDKIIPYAC